MATKPDDGDKGGAHLGQHVSSDWDFERFLPSLHGDRFYLQSSQEDFFDLLSSTRSEDENTIEKSDPTELTEIAKRALGKDELEIAETYFVKAIRISILDGSSKKSPEPYFYLAEILQKKAEDKKLKLLQKQRYLLQAAALYNFVRNYLESRDTDVELSKKLSKEVSRKLLDIQDNMIKLCGGNPLKGNFDAEGKKNELKELRNEVKDSLESLESLSSSSNQGRLNDGEARQKFKDQTPEVKKLSDTISDRMKQFFASIIDECLVVLGTPSCDYEVIVFGSIARNETTPYSDFEWAILTSSEEEECKVFFRNLTNLVHLQVINLGETILPSMNIDAINGEWFYDDVTPRGVSLDGLLPQACKIPLGNMKDFELIHTPEKMAEFQSNHWYRKNWSLADTLMTFCPLQSEKSVLVKAYRKETDKILSCLCDSESCQHDSSSDTWPTRGSCRGLRVLQEDLSRYWDLMTGNNDLDEGKFYDVKKEIYRLPDRLITALAKCCEVKSDGIFDILDELFEKEVISSEARDNLASASAIAIRLRLSTYLKVGKQDEQLNIISNEEPGENVPVYHMPTDEELFHFFFVAIPLYDELRQFKTFGNIPSSLASCSFFNNSGQTIGHIYCRLLRYDKAIECYERAVQENPDNLSAEIRRIRLSLLVTQNTQESDKVQENFDNLLVKLVKNFSLLDTDDKKPPPEFTPLINCLDMEEYQQLFAGLLFAFEIYNSLKYLRVAMKILDRFKIPSTLNEFKSLPKDVSALIVLLLAYMTTSNFYIPHLVQEHEIDTSVSTLTLVIEKEGVSTKNIVLLNSLGKLLYNKGELDKAYRCFQRSLSMQYLLYGNKPSEKRMTSLYFLGRIASKLKMYEESKCYFKSVVQQSKATVGIKNKLLVKYTYLRLLCQSCTVEETLHFAEHGLKVTTINKKERELLLNCALYWAKAIKLYEQSPEQAWEAVLNANACRKGCTHLQTREKIIFYVGYVLHRIKKSKEGIELLEKELQTLTLQSQQQEKVACLKALGKLCLVEGLAPEAKKYYSQAIDIQEEKDEHAFHDFECRIGILKATVMEDSVSKEKPVLDKALLSSAMKLPAYYEKCFFLKETGEFCQTIGEIGDARLCYLAALRSATELPASDEKCSFLKNIGKLFESISEIALAQQCYYEALKTYKKESTITKKLPLVEVDLEMCLGMLAKKMISIDSAQRIHYDRAVYILRQHVETGHVNSETVRMLFALGEVYITIDKNEAIHLLLESLKVSEIMYGEDKSHEMVTTSLQLLSLTYHLLGDMRNCMKYREQQIKMELEQFSSNPFLERIVSTLKKLAFTSFHVLSSKDNIELVSDFFLSSLNDKALLNTIATRTIAAKCFTFIAVLFYTSDDFEKAKSLNEKAIELFGEVEESIEAERDPYRELCYLIKTMFSSEKTLPSHWTELYISCFNIGDPYPDIVSAEEERGGHAGDEELIKGELKQEAQSSLADEQSTLSPPPIVQSQLETFEHYKSKREFQIAAEIHASLQQQQLSFYKDSPFDGEEKLIGEAIEAKNESQFSKAIRLLDLALQLQLPDAQCRQTTKILKLRGECFLSMGHFRSAAIDFTKAVTFYSIETIDNREELCEYSEVLIGLIKSEILCNNIDAALLVCEKGIKLATDRKLNQQAEKLLYLKVRCIIILLERGERENKLDLASYLYEEVLFLCDLAEEDFKTIFEILFLLDDIFPSLPPKNENENTFDEIKRGKTMTIADRVNNIYASADLMGNVSSVNLSNAEPNVLMKVAISCSLKARVLIYSGELDQSINWLDRSLAAFCSFPLPDLLWYFEDFVSLLQAITATKSSAPDQSRSPFQQAIDRCCRTLISQNKSTNYVNKFLTTSIIIYRSLGQAQEAMVVAEIGLEINDMMCHNSDNDKLNNRGRMLLHLAQIHQQNSSNPTFNADEELNLAEHYYDSDRGREGEMLLCKNLSYANFLCERKRFAKAVTALEGMRISDGRLLLNKYVFIEYFSCAFYGAGVEKSVKIDGELLMTVEDVLYNLLVRAYVGMGKKKEAVAACETLTDVNSPDVQEPVYGKRPSCKPYLVEDCHRKLLSLLSEEDQHQFQNCEFPLSSPNVLKLYYMLGQYEMAVKYLPKDVKSAEMLEMKISCLRLAGNELIDLNRGDESISFFSQFLEMLQDKEGFLDKPFNNQCKILQTCYFANQYYFFRSLGEMHVERENIDAAIQCYERCIELDEDFMFGQDIVVSLSELYQTKALTLTVDLDNEDSRTVYMDLAWELFQKLLQKTAELAPCVELSFALLLTRLNRYEEAVDHFYKVIGRADDKLFLAFGNMDKSLVDAYLRREIEASGRPVIIQGKVLAAYELVLTLMKLNQKRKAQNLASCLERLVKNPLEIRHGTISCSVVGYAHAIIGNKEKAAKIFESVLKVNPGHPPVTEALKSLRT